MDADVAAERVADMINRRGPALTKGDGTPIRPDDAPVATIPEERLGQIERMVTNDMLDGINSRPIVFNLAPDDAQYINGGDVLLYKGNQWRVHPSRTVSGPDDVMVGIFASMIG